MYTAQDLLNEKNNRLHVIDPEATIVDATMLMNAEGIGALVVTEGRRAVGILSERDVLRRVVAAQLDPAVTPVRRAMTRRVIRCSSETALEQVRAMMDRWRIRHVPVEDPEDGLCGMISMRDLNTWQIRQDGVQIAYLTQYVYGRA